MLKNNYPLRAILLISGLFFVALGVAFTIKSQLGTSPISSVPYVISLVIPSFSVGFFTIITNLLFVSFQAIILKSDFKPIMLLQVPFIFLFGWFIDFSLMLLSHFTTSSYAIHWLFCILGCVIMAFGLFLQLKSKITYLPSEALIIAISKKAGPEYGKMKIIFDSTLIIVALTVSLAFIHGIYGIREGTVAGALIVGGCIHLFTKHITVFDKLTGRDYNKERQQQEPYMFTDKLVITIAREYGSGGHAIGALIAKKLGIAFYDSNLIDLTAQESGFTLEYVKENEQKLSNDFLHKLYRQNYYYVDEVIPPEDVLFMVQTKVIRDIAAKESCVIVGRCADYILKGHPNIFSVFVHADKEFRLKRIVTDYKIEPKNAVKVMELKDRERISYNSYYTHRTWNAAENYDFYIESSRFGIEASADIILDARLKALNAKAAPTKQEDGIDAGQ